jgi:DNA-binding CsgD family transcriptional regulator
MDAIFAAWGRDAARPSVYASALGGESVHPVQASSGAGATRGKDHHLPTNVNAAHDGCPCGYVQSRRLTNAATDRPHLTKRQREIVLAWLKYGTKERAAKELFVTPSTVKTHIQRIRKSYDDVGRPAGTKFALFIRAIQDGLINIDDDEALRRFFSDHDGDGTEPPVRR